MTWTLTFQIAGLMILVGVIVNTVAADLIRERKK